MTVNDELAPVERYYAAGGDRTVIDDVMSADVVWDITPGFPLGGTFHGLSSVRADFLAPLGQLFTTIKAQPDQLFGDGAGHVTVLGYYTAAMSGGRQAACRFVHLWTVADGQLQRLDQTADSAVLVDLLAD